MLQLPDTSLRACPTVGGRDRAIVGARCWYFKRWLATGEGPTPAAEMGGLVSGNAPAAKGARPDD
jgi:hypothetical protein